MRPSSERLRQYSTSVAASRTDVLTVLLVVFFRNPNDGLLDLVVWNFMAV